MSHPRFTFLTAIVMAALFVAPSAEAAVWRGHETASAGRSAGDGATAFVRAHKSALQLRSGEEALPEQVRASLSGKYVRLGRYVSGLRVDGGDVIVHAASDGSFDFARTRDLPAFSGSTTPTVSLADADAVARRAAHQGAAARTQIANLILYASDGSLRLAWDIWLFADKPTQRWRVVVDAQTKDVLFAEDLVQNVNGSGEVFNPSPVVVLQDNGLTDDDDADAAVPAGAYSTVTLLDLDPADGGFFHLSGPYARAVEIEDPVSAPPAEVSTTFSYTRADDNFEWVMIYFHTDSLQRYFQSLGFTDINNRVIDFDAHAVDGEDNSHYSPDGVGTGPMAFGDGGVDDGEDGEVIVHELGHSVQDNQCVNCNQGPESRAMGEGFGDFLAATYFLDVSAGFQDPCAFDWDSAPSCGRRLDGVKTYPADLENEVHADGEIWSGALWDVLLAISGGPTPTLLARDIVLKIVLESNFLRPSGPSFYEGAQALLDAEDNLFGGTYHTVLFNALDARGLIPLCGAAPLPAVSCFQQFKPKKASVLIADKSDDKKDQLQWKWNQGVATTLADFGNPLSSTTRYELCVYDASGNGQPLSIATVAGGGTCKNKPCWKATGTTGFKYNNPAGNLRGITQIQMKAGANGKSQVKVLGKGVNLPTPDPSLTLPVTLQLLVDDGGPTKCWQTTFTAATKNDATQFKATGP